jgi:hypothetical protein
MATTKSKIQTHKSKINKNTRKMSGLNFVFFGFFNASAGLSTASQFLTSITVRSLDKVFKISRICIKLDAKRKFKVHFQGEPKVFSLFAQYKTLEKCDPLLQYAFRHFNSKLLFLSHINA